MKETQTFYKKGNRYIQVLTEDEYDAQVLAVTFEDDDYLSDYGVKWIAPKWKTWEPLTIREFLAAVARFAEIEKRYG